MELFLSGDFGARGYYHLALDIHGNRYDSTSEKEAEAFSCAWEGKAERTAKGEFAFVDPENPRFAVREGALYDKDLTELFCCPVSAAQNRT